MEISTLNNFDFVRPATKALWTFDEEDGIDSSPNGNDLPVGSPSYELGKFGQAISLDGYEYLRAASPFTSLSLSALSILAWIKTTASGEGILFSNIYDTEWTGYGFAFGYIGNRIYFLVGDGSDWLYEHVANNINVCDNKWHFVAISRGSTYTRIYIDGMLDLQESNAPLGYTDYEMACIGALYSPIWGDYRFPGVGAVDSLHILSGELGYATVRRMYAFQMGWI